MGSRVLNNSLASNPVVGLRGGFDDRQNIERVKPDGARQNDQFDDVDPAFAALNTRNERLMALEPVRHCLLYTSPSPRDGLLSRMPSSA